MHWIAPSEKDIATDTLERRLWAAAGQFRAERRAMLHAVDVIENTIAKNVAEILEA